MGLVGNFLLLIWWLKRKSALYLLRKKDLELSQLLYLQVMWFYQILGIFGYAMLFD